MSEVSRVANHVGALHACDHERKKILLQISNSTIKSQEKE